MRNSPFLREEARVKGKRKRRIIGVVNNNKELASAPYQYLSHNRILDRRLIQACWPTGYQIAQVVLNSYDANLKSALRLRHWPRINVK